MKEAFPVHGANISWAASRYGIPAGDFLDFSSNINPLGPPEAALKAARQSLAFVSRYPEPDAGALRGEIASFLNVPADNLMLGNGSTELIHHLCRCLLAERVTVAVPTFGEYSRAAEASGSILNLFHLEPGEGFSLMPERLAASAAEADITFFCNPGSPSGRLYSREELLPALEACRLRNNVLAVDESFMDFCRDAEAAEASLLREIPGGGLVVISTLTKIFALAGLRGPGLLAAAPALVRKLEEAAPPWRVNVVAEAAARASLGDVEYLERTRSLIPVWREHLREGLSALKLFRPFPSDVNYILLRLESPHLEVKSLVDALGHRGILVRDCGNFTGLGEGFLRVAVRPPAETERLLGELKDILNAMKGSV